MSVYTFTFPATPIKGGAPAEIELTVDVTGSMEKVEGPPESRSYSYVFPASNVWMRFRSHAPNTWDVECAHGPPGLVGTHHHVDNHTLLVFNDLTRKQDLDLLGGIKLPLHARACRRTPKVDKEVFMDYVFPLDNYQIELWSPKGKARDPWFIKVYTLPPARGAGRTLEHELVFPDREILEKIDSFVGMHDPTN